MPNRPSLPSHSGTVFSLLLVLLPLALSVAAPAGAQQRVASSRVSPRERITVSTSWLAAHLRDPKVVLLHVGARAEYEMGHIAGARLVSLDDVSVNSHDHARGLMLELPAPEVLRARLEALGISDGDRVIVYHGGDWVSQATRVVFTLDHAGLDAALLDGGLPAWKGEGRPLSSAALRAVTGTLSALRVKPLVVDAAWIRPRIGTPGFHLVDARAAVFFDGVERGGSRKGHIAGARSVPFTEVTDDQLRLRSPEELKRLFHDAGIAPGDTVVAYCHIGQQATAVLFAARSLGHPVLLYDGSYQDWSRRGDLPVEDPRRGAGTGR